MVSLTEQTKSMKWFSSYTNIAILKSDRKKKLCDDNQYFEKYWDVLYRLKLLDQNSISWYVYHAVWEINKLAHSFDIRIKI